MVGLEINQTGLEVMNPLNARQMNATYTNASRASARLNTYLLSIDKSVDLLGNQRKNPNYAQLMEVLYNSFTVLGSNGTTVYKNNTWNLCEPSLVY